ncbi:MAG: response regulator transcription factor, partial [Candidatus Obscuribacterales bacterium]|nr:response regulator transcription factor [Candidatus Obscuribacterales bacterium]
VVEDDLDLCVMISDSLCAQMHTVEIANTGLEGRDRLLSFEYDVIILDWDLPGLSGVDVLKELRDRGCSVPVLMLTGKSGLEFKERGLDSGADDYLTKPFAMKELHARLRALLRRPQGFSGVVFSAGNLLLDPTLHKVSREGVEIKLLPKEMSLLEFFMRHKGQVFTAEAVLNRVWSSESEATPESFRTCLKRLRQKIDQEGKPSVIEYINGLGYRISS